MSEIEDYQHDLRNILFPVHFNDSHKDPLNTDHYVAYSIEDPKLRKFLHYWYIFQTAQDFDFSWYDQCKTYISNMPPSDQYRIRCYSQISDEVVNSYLRNPATFLETFPFSKTFRRMEDEHLYFFLPDLLEDVGHVGSVWSSEGTLRSEFHGFAKELLATQISNNLPRLVEYIHKYIDHLRRILRAAPRSPQNFRVFRGVKTDYLRSEEVGQFRGFSSTTWYPRVAYFFGEEENMVYEIQVDRATPALCIHSVSEHEEYEVLLDTDIYGVADREIVKYHLDLYQGSGRFPPIHMWNPEETEMEGVAERTYKRTRAVFVHPEAAPLQGGRIQLKNRVSVRPRRSTRRKSLRSPRPMFDPKDLASPAFVPVPSSVSPRLLQSLRTYQQENPRRRIK